MKIFLLNVPYNLKNLGLNSLTYRTYNRNQRVPCLAILLLIFVGKFSSNIVIVLHHLMKFFNQYHHVDAKWPHEWVSSWAWLPQVFPGFHTEQSINPLRNVIFFLSILCTCMKHDQSLDVCLGQSYLIKPAIHQIYGILHKKYSLPVHTA